jgi:hypothetical protein
MVMHSTTTWQIADQRARRAAESAAAAHARKIEARAAWSRRERRRALRAALRFLTAGAGALRPGAGRLSMKRGRLVNV